MYRYILNRLVSSIPVFFLVSVIVFLLIHLIPGDPIEYLFSGEKLTPTLRAEHAKALGLDKPLPVQYWDWMSRLANGDFGNSIQMGRPISQLILERLPATLLLTIAASVISVMIALPAGIISAVKRNSPYDFHVMMLALLGMSVPNYWLGILLILFFAVYLGLLPASGYADLLTDPVLSLKYLILPSLTLGAGMAAVVARMIRSEILEQISKEYVRTARAKGLPEHLVIFKHALKNALIPTITVVGVQFGRLLGGAVIVERVFSWPGIGSLMVDAIFSRDYPLVQAGVLMFAVIFVGVNFVVDILYKFVNPRIALQ